MLDRAVARLGRLMGRSAATEPMVSATERRLWVRHVCEVETTFYPVNSHLGPPLSARVRDISRTGIRLVVERPFRPGEFLSVELLPGEGKPASTVLAYVVRAQARSAKEWILGCAFALELADDDLEPFGARRLPAEPSDNRRWARSRCDVQAVAQNVRQPMAGPVKVQVLDVSANGCGLGVSQAVEIGTLLSLDLTSAAGSAPLTILASVVRVSLQPGGEWFLGCTFVRDLEAGELDRLLAHRTAPADHS